MEWSREQTVRLIRSLKRQEIVWNSRSKSYKDRKKKTLAWGAIESEVGIPVNFCKRRVESLLASCRREKNKIRKSKTVDEPEFLYEPKWIYWNEFKFLRGLPDDPEDDSQYNLDMSQPIVPQWSPSARRPPRKRKKAQEPALLLKPEPPRPAPVLSTPSKSPWECDEHDAFGITVAAKLRKMDPNQRLYAENIINQTLYKGMLFQLNESTDAEFLQTHRIMHAQPEIHHPQVHTEEHTFIGLRNACITRTSNDQGAPKLLDMYSGDTDSFCILPNPKLETGKMSV